MTTAEFIKKTYNTTNDKWTKEGYDRRCASVLTSRIGVVFSYGYHYPLAFHVAGLDFINEAGYSNTTSKHIGWARAALNYNYVGVKLNREEADVIGNEYITDDNKLEAIKRALERESMPKQPMKNRQPYKRTLNGLFCKVCGTELVGTQKNVCSDRECDLEYNRRRSYGYDSAKKVMKPRQCKECGKRFIPGYGNKRRTFCSEECSVKYGRRVCKAIRKARLRGVNDSKIEWIDPLFICERDGWRCYLCGVKTPKKLRGTCELIS